MRLVQKLRKWLKRHRGLYRAFRTTVDRIRLCYRHAFMFLVGRVKGIDPQKVVFSSFWGTNYSDNPRYISEKLHEMAPQLDIVWQFRDECINTVQAPDYVRRIPFFGWKAMTELATARVWVDNLKRSQSFLFRPDKQIYFNTWHGDRGFKRVGKDNTHTTYHARTERFCDAMIAGSEFGAGTYRTAFEFQGKVLMDGCPRNDILVRNDPAEAAALRRRMNLPEDVKLMVFAPTYRDVTTREGQRAELDLSAALDCLEAHTGERWLCLLRAHFLSGGIQGGRADERVIDVSGWPEMAEILLVSDLLITDYSSCAGDFILRDKPAILYQPDLEDYENGSRELYFDMRESPFFIATDMAEFDRIVAGLTEESVRENCRQWREFFGVTETGHASEASARFILKTMAEKK